MRTWFQRAGAGRILAGIGFVVLSATVGGCLSSDKPAAKHPASGQKNNTSTATNTGLNTGTGLQGTVNPNQTVNQNPGLSPIQNTNSNPNGFKSTSGSFGNPSGGIGMNSGPVSNNSAGAANNPAQFGQNPVAVGTPTSGGLQPIATSNNNRLQPVSSNGQVNLTGVQPDPTPGSAAPLPVTMQSSDRLNRQNFQRESPPRMDSIDNSSIQPVGLPAGTR